MEGADATDPPTCIKKRSPTREEHNSLSSLNPAVVKNQHPSTPINVKAWRPLVADHPDQRLVTEICEDLIMGVDIGFRGTPRNLVTRNMLSAFENPDVVRKTIDKEIAAGWSLGPFDVHPYPQFVINSIGVIPKKTGGHRMITDLSRPAEGVNHSICKEDFSIQYSSIDDAVAILKRVGRHAFMCKLDIKDAFRLIPVRKKDWPLLGYQWDEQFYFHTKLPFGLRSSPFHFNRMATLLAWTIRHHSGSTGLINYLDDFWCGDVPERCEHTFQVAQDICSKIAVPLADGKLVGPTSIITFLGIEIDASSQTLSLPHGKLNEIQQELLKWLAIKKCTKRQLLSLVGKLSFASKCIPAGRLFFRRLIDLSMKAQKLHHRLDLTKEAREDILWWCKFMPLWNGTAHFIDAVWQPADTLDLFTDAASSVGAGGFYCGKWFFVAWPQQIKDNKQIHITWMELFPIVVAARLWGHLWSGRRIMFHSDNKAVVDIWYKGSSKSPLVMSLVRQLFFTAARFNFHVAISHVPGHINVIADLISRNLQVAFHRKVPSADQDPTQVPSQIIQDLFPSG
jgi:hypothetical protein